jgi:hypothetical protein
MLSIKAAELFFHLYPLLLAFKESVHCGGRNAAEYLGTFGVVVFSAERF